MFVSDQRYILKTCGTTRLMDSLDYLLELAEKYGGLTQVQVRKDGKCIHIDVLQYAPCAFAFRMSFIQEKTSFVQNSSQTDIAVSTLKLTI